MPTIVAYVQSNMKSYSVIKVSAAWSTDQLRSDVEKLLNEKADQGFDIITVSFGVNLFWMPTAFITLCK